jgi:hypothetical protein
MNNFRKLGVLVFLSFLLLVPSLSVRAADAPPSSTDPLAGVPIVGRPVQTGASAGLSSCFDYYKFGSVTAAISASLSEVSQGALISFTGTLTNENNYPLTDATVYVKIFHSRGAVRTDANGPDVVDFFAPVQHVNLKANESLPISFQWKVPTDIEPGNYSAATFVVTNNRFEMLGLVFTDDVVGNMENFQVVGEDIGALRFDKASAMVNGQMYHYAAFPVTIPAGVTNVPVSSDIVNTTKTPYQGTITWSAYYWDPVNQEHLIGTKTDAFSVGAKATSTVSYAVTDTAHSVYYVEGKINSKDGAASSVIGIRFVRRDVNEPRFNFVGVVNNTAVACVHSSGTGDAPNSKVTINVIENTWYSKLLAKVGIGVLASASYNGAISGNIAALTKTLSHPASSYLLSANLWQNGKQIDSVSIMYSCTDLGTKCPNSLISISIAVISVLVLLLLLILAVRAFQKKKIQNNSYQTPTPSI